MGVAMYLIFSKIWRPTTRYRFVLLIAIFILYLLIGAYIFSILNYPQEKIEISQLLTFQNQFYLNHTCIKRQDLENLVHFIIKTNDKGVYYYSINDSSTKRYVPKWKFGGGTIFFVYTLLATIGYGHLAPYTSYGKIFTIIYISIGVPITLLLLSSLTDKFVEWIEENLFKIKQNNEPEMQHQQDNEEKSCKNYIFFIKYSFLFVIFAIIIFILPAFVLSKYFETGWSYLESIYFCFISLTTIGLGVCVFFTMFN